MIALLDVNVLVALVWPNHVHHRAARAWFRVQRDFGWATCPTTQNGFIRVSSNNQIIPEAKSPHEAALLLRSLTSSAGHTFWSEDASLLDEKCMPLHGIRTHRQVTDAYLLTVALVHRGCLATFDRGITRLLPDRVDPGHALQLMPFDVQS